MPTIPAAVASPSGGAKAVNGTSAANALDVLRKSGEGKSREGQLANDQGNAWTRLLHSFLKSHDATAPAKSADAPASPAVKLARKASDRKSAQSPDRADILSPNAVPTVATIHTSQPASKNEIQDHAPAPDANVAASPATASAATSAVAISGALTGVNTKSATPATAATEPLPAAQATAQGTLPVPAQISVPQGAPAPVVAVAPTAANPAAQPSQTQTAVAAVLDGATVAVQGTTPSAQGQVSGLSPQAMALQNQMRDAVVTMQSPSADTGSQSGSGGSFSDGDASPSDSSASTGDASVMQPTVAFAVPTQLPASNAVPGPAQPSVDGASREERMAVVQQVSGQISAMHASKSVANSTVTIHLSPERWGDMKISVRMTDDPKGDLGNLRGVEATLTATTSAIRDMLQTHAKDLQQALEQSGMRVEKLDFVVGSTAQASTDLAQQNSGRHFSGHQDPNPNAQSSFSFSQGGGNGTFSQNAGNGSGQSNGYSTASGGLYPGSDSALPQQPLEAVSKTNGSGLVDYRI